MKEHLNSLRAEHEDVKEKRDLHMALFESIPDVEKPKRDRAVGSPTSTPEVKRYKPSQPEKSTDLATGKSAGPSAQGKSFPAQLPEEVGWGDDQDDSPEEGGIDETAEKEKPAASGKAPRCAGCP